MWFKSKVKVLSESAYQEVSRASSYARLHTFISFPVSFKFKFQQICCYGLDLKRSSSGSCIESLVSSQ